MMKLPRWLSNILTRGSSERTTISSVKKSWTGSKSNGTSMDATGMKTSQKKKKEEEVPDDRYPLW